MTEENDNPPEPFWKNVLQLKRKLEQTNVVAQNKEIPQTVKQALNKQSNQNRLNISHTSFNSNRSKVLSKEPRIDVFYKEDQKDSQQQLPLQQPQPQPHTQIHYKLRQTQKIKDFCEQNGAEEIDRFMGQFVDHIHDLGYDMKNLNYSFCVSQKQDSQKSHKSTPSQVLEQINFSQIIYQNQKKQDKLSNGVEIMAKINQTHSNLVNTNFGAPNHYHSQNYHHDERSQENIATPSFPLQDLHGLSDASYNTTHQIKKFNSMNIDNVFLQRIKKIRQNETFNQAQNNFVKKSSSQKEQIDNTINNFSSNAAFPQTSHHQTSFNNDEFPNDQGQKAKKLFQSDRSNNWLTYSNTPLLQIQQTQTLPAHKINSLKERLLQLDKNVSQIKQIKKQIQTQEIPKQKQEFKGYLKILSSQVAKRLEQFNQCQQLKTMQLQKHVSGLLVENQHLKQLNSQLQSSLRIISQQQYLQPASQKSDSAKQNDPQQSSVIKPYQQFNQEGQGQLLKLQSKQAKKMQLKYSQPLPQSHPFKINEECELHIAELQQQINFLKHDFEQQQKKCLQLAQEVASLQAVTVNYQEKELQVSGLQKQNQKLSQYIFDLEQRVAQFQQNVSFLTHQISKTKDMQRQNFREQLQKILQKNNEQFSKKLQHVQKQHQKDVQLLQLAFFQQIQRMRSQNILSNPETEQKIKQNIVLQELKIPQSISMPTVTSQKQSNYTKNQQQNRLKKMRQLQEQIIRLNTQIKTLRLSLETQSIFINQLKNDKAQSEQLLKDQKNRVKQLQIGAQHDWQTYSIKERELQNEIKVLKYQLLQQKSVRLDRQQQLKYQRDEDQRLRPFNNIKIQQLFSRNNSRNNEKKKIVSKSKSKSRGRSISKTKTSLQLLTSSREIRPPNDTIKKFQSLNFNPKLRNLTNLNYHCQQKQSNFQAQNRVNYHDNESYYSPRYNPDKINRILANIKAKYQPSNSSLLNSRQRLIIQKQDHALNKYAAIDTKSSQSFIQFRKHSNYNLNSTKRKFQDIFSTIPISPSSVNLQKSIKMNQISQKLQKLRLDIRKQLNYSKN